MIRKHHRREKFLLELEGGAQVATMEELRQNFDLEKIMDYLEDGRLEKWLRDRFYAAEADAIKTLHPDDEDTPEKICDILGVDYEQFADLAEEIFWRRERLDHLLEITDDEEILQHVDDVAFDQEDLEDILSSDEIPEVIYLCDEHFTFPSGILRIKNIHYVGIIKNVTVVIESNKEVDLDALRISFENVRLEGAFISSRQEEQPRSSRQDRMPPKTYSNSRINEIMKNKIDRAAPKGYGNYAKAEPAYDRQPARQPEPPKPVYQERVPRQPEPSYQERAARQPEPAYQDRQPAKQPEPPKPAFQERPAAPRPDESSKTHDERTAVIQNKTGVHTGPAYAFVQLASKFKSKIGIKGKGKSGDAKSILMIMSMGLMKGTEVTITADGPDAKEAVDALIGLIENKFDQE